MGRQKLDKLCQAVLPDNFEQVKRWVPELQRFLEENLPEPVNRCVTLLTINREEIVLSANSPAVASYLRMHSREIGQQLSETFQFEQQIRICTLPDSMLRLNDPVSRPPPREASAASVDAIRRNAEWIEDDELRASMLALADSMELNR